MKAMIWILVLAGAGVGIAYFSFSGFDPTEQGKQARAKITNGMTLKQVNDIAGTNCRYIQINAMKQMIGGKSVETIQPGQPADFDADRVDARIKAGGVPHGFMLRYTFSNQEAFDVEFDSKGLVSGIMDAPKLGDLFQSQ